jgi:hypothetical protein
MIWSAATQPTPSISAAAIGAMTNWPNEPPALTMPVASPLLPGGSKRVVAAISTAGPAMPAPPADSTPIAKISPTVLVISGVMKVPKATSSTPASSTAPRADAVGHGAGEGLRQPPEQLPKANARLMLPRPSPVEVLIGDRNRPMVWRVPMVSAKVPAAANSTNQSAG